MKKLSVLFVVFFFIAACALIPKKTTKIFWPDSIQYMEAFCELEMLWKEKKYSGSMSLKLEYPENLVIDVFGPFGETAIHMEKEGEKFILVTKEGSLSEEDDFERDFGIKLSDFIDDLAIKTYKKGDSSNEFIERKGYKIKYNLDGIDGESSICWTIKDGNMCINFIETKFLKQQE